MSYCDCNKVAIADCVLACIVSIIITAGVFGLIFYNIGYYCARNEVRNQAIFHRFATYSVDANNKIEFVWGQSTPVKVKAEENDR